MSQKIGSALVAPVHPDDHHAEAPGARNLMGELMAALAPFITTYDSCKRTLVQQEGGETPCLK